MEITIRRVSKGNKFNLLALNLQQGLVLTSENAIVAAYSQHANKVVLLQGTLDYDNTPKSSEVIEFLEECQLIDCNANNYSEQMTDSFGLDYWDVNEDEHLRV